MEEEKLNKPQTDKRSERSYLVARDLREFQDQLSESGDLVTVKKTVSTEHEIAAYIRRSCKTGGPAFLFTNVAEHQGWTVAGGTYAVLNRVYKAVGASKEEAVKRYLDATVNPMAVERVSTGVVKEVQLSGNQIDLASIPLVKHCEKDGGRYITAGIQVVRDPETGVQHLGIHRMMLQDKRLLTLWGGLERRVRRTITRNEDRSKNTPIAIVLGGPPAFVLASCARVPHFGKKYDIASAIQGRPLEVVQCDTNDLEVPAWSEMVLEGEVLCKERMEEGPFGEFSGAYGPKTSSPVVRIDKITMRQDAIYQTFLTGFPMCEDQSLMWLPRTAVVMQDASRAHPEVKAATWLVDSGDVYGVAVSIRKRMDGEPYNIISAILGGAALVKSCIVVDEDVDVFDPVQVQWALSTRVQPDRDILKFPVMVGAPLDPSAPIPRHTSKIGYDATVPLKADRLHYERVYVPGEDDVTW